MSNVMIVKRPTSRACKCKHFNGVMNDTCKAGVKYTDVRVDHDPVEYRYEGDPPTGRPYSMRRSLPCFTEGNYGGATCDKLELPTPEEVAAEEAEIARMTAGVMKARAAIVTHCGGPWRKGNAGSQGVIVCPVCEQPEALRFKRSGYNGHVAAACKTKGCVGWME